VSQPVQASGGDSHGLAVALAPVMRRVTGERLGPVTWFRCRWQRGGAATGLSTWRRDDGRVIDVFVKLPVGFVEYRWTTELGRLDEASWESPAALRLPVPRVAAHGTELGGYDLAWIVTERLPGHPLALGLDHDGLVDLIDAAAEFQASAMKVAPLGTPPPSPDWDHLLERSKAVLRDHDVPETPKWKDALRHVHKALPLLKAAWHARPINAWCHGDLHAGNCMRRDAGDGRAPCVLIDLALVHAGHWLEDAIYLERQHWGHADLLHGVKPLGELAKRRRERGLPVDDGYPRLANIRRVLMASCAPAMIDREGDRAYLHAALDVLQRFLPQVVREFDL
jgi:hypothetical protein